MRQNHPNTPAPAPFKELPVQFIKTVSTVWTRERFVAAVNAPHQSPLFARIAHRRKWLRRLKSRPLHDTYEGQELTHDQKRITAAMISLSPRYGTLIYALTSAFGARQVLEAGSGYGISSMYLAVALEETSDPESLLMSFELATYAAQAQKSLDLITGGDLARGQIIRDDFNALGRYVPARASFDVAFIDSRHDADMLLRNCRSAHGWMAPRSMILIDDVSYSDITRQAWDEICAQDTYPFAALINNRIGVLSA